MERHNIKHQIETYKDKLQLAVRHPILKRDIGEVIVDKAKAFFLLLPMLNGEEWTESMNEAALAVGAVHVAFNAHDTVERTGTATTEQQLTVLAGDYYSGIHYKILASLQDTGFIRSLSSMIGEINEIKTNYHKHSPINANELQQAIQTIESGCIVTFLQTFGFEQYVPLVTAALPLYTLDPVLDNSEKRPIWDVLGWEISEHEITLVLTELRKQMDEAIESATFITPFLREEMRGMTAPLLGKMS